MLILGGMAMIGLAIARFKIANAVEAKRRMVTEKLLLRMVGGDKGRQPASVASTVVGLTLLVIIPGLSIGLGVAYDPSAPPSKLLIHVAIACALVTLVATFIMVVFEAVRRRRPPRHRHPIE